MTSLRTFLDSLPDSEIFRLKDPLNLDYIPTALVIEFEKQKQFPALYIEQPRGFEMPVVANLFADRRRIAHMVGVASPAEFNEAWLRAESNPRPPVMVDS